MLVDTEDEAENKQTRITNINQNVLMAPIELEVVPDDSADVASGTCRMHADKAMRSWC